MIAEREWNNLITKYIIEKVRGGYEPSCTKEEIVNFLNYIANYVTFCKPEIGYEYVLENYLNGLGSKKEEWSFGSKKTLYRTIVQQTESGLIIPTYYLTNYVSGAKNDKLDNCLKDYIEKFNSKRKNDVSGTVDEAIIEFSERALAALVQDIWDTKRRWYISRGEWPKQCDDIKEFLLDNDLANIMKLPSMRDNLIDFYHTVSKRLMHIVNNDFYFRMTNDEAQVLAKSNFDIVTDGYPYYEMTYGSEKIVAIDYICNEIEFTVDRDDERYEGRKIKTKLDSPKVLKLVNDLNAIK